jgi:hypothetical protein
MEDYRQAIADYQTALTLKGDEEFKKSIVGAGGQGLNIGDPAHAAR